MKNIRRTTYLPFLASLIISCFTIPAPGQEDFIPDPGLNAAIRDALQKPVGPLTAQDMLGLTNLNAGNRNIRDTQGLEAAHNLAVLDLDFNDLGTLAVPGGLTKLGTLTLLGNRTTNLVLSGNMTNLSFLDADDNALANFTLPAGLTQLNALHLSGNQLTDFSLPRGLTNLAFLSLAENQLTNVSLPSDLDNLAEIDLGENMLDSFTLPPGLVALASIDLDANVLATLTLPPDMTNLTSIFVDGNPFKSLVVSESLAATNLASSVASLRNQGITVSTYSLAISLVQPHRKTAGDFEFSLSGPPGVYAVLASTNLIDWQELGAVTNDFGSASFSDPRASLSPNKFYRVRLGQ